MPPLRLGILGCGIAARELHRPALASMQSKWTVATVCNHTPQKAKALAKAIGGAAWTLDYKEVLADPDIDAVAIILPVELNLPVTQEALAAGKHVLVEKPLAATLSECRQMVRLAAKTDRVAMLAENFRYRPAIRLLRKMIDEKSFGTIHAVQWNSVTDLAPETSQYARTQWRLDHKYPGGYPMDGGVHNVHALRFLFGEITEVRGWTRQINLILGDVDMHQMEFDTATGVHGTFSNYFSAKGIWEDRLMIYGTEATAVLQHGKLTVHRRGKKAREIDTKDDGGYRGEYEAFHAAITKGAPVETTFEEGLRDFRVIELSFKSARVGKSLKVQ